MRELKRILLATDFLAPARDALTEACLLARTFDAEIVLVHAVPIPAVPEFGIEDHLEESVADARDRCEQIAAEKRERGVRFASDPVIEVGDPATVIVRVAKEGDIDLIVLGGGDKPILGALLFHPVLERVMRSTARPVWVTRPQIQSLKVERLLCAVDPSRPTGIAFGLSLFLARVFGAALDLLAVVPHSKSWRDPSEQRDWLGAYLEEFSLLEQREGVNIEVVARDGEAGARIVDMAAERQSDLVVMGSGGRSGLRRWLRGDTAARAARGVPCSLLTITTVEQGDSGRLLQPQ